MHRQPSDTSDNAVTTHGFPPENEPDAAAACEPGRYTTRAACLHLLALEANMHDDTGEGRLVLVKQ